MSIHSDIYQRILWFINPFLVSNFNTSGVLTGINSLFVQSKNISNISHPFHIIFPLNISTPDNTIDVLDKVKNKMGSDFISYNSNIIKYIEYLSHHQFDFHYENDKFNPNNIFVYAFGHPVGICSITSNISSNNYFMLDNLLYHRVEYMKAFYNKNMEKYNNAIDEDDYIKCLLDKGESNKCFFKRYCGNMILLLDNFQLEPCFRVGRVVDIPYCDSKVIIGNPMDPGTLTHLNNSLLTANNPNTPAYKVDKIVKDWTINSTTLTSHMKNYIFGKMMNKPYNLTDDIKSQIMGLQYACTRTILPEDIVVYKCMRSVFYNALKSNTAFKIGESYQQYLFNSTTVNREFDTSVFSELHYGNCAFMIFLPKGTLCSYIGHSKRSQYPDEYELLLPVGCMFKINNIIKDSYIFSKGNYRKITYYICEYIPPPSSFYLSFSMDKLQLKVTDVVLEEAPEKYDSIRFKEILNYFKKILHGGIKSSKIKDEIKFISGEEDIDDDIVTSIAYNAAIEEGVYSGSLDDFLKDVPETPLEKRKYGGVSLNRVEEYIRKYIKYNNLDGLKNYIESIDHQDEKINGSKILCELFSKPELPAKSPIDILLSKKAGEIMDFDVSILDCFIQSDNIYFKYADLVFGKVFPSIYHLQKAVDVDDLTSAMAILKTCELDLSEISLEKAGDEMIDLFTVTKRDCGVKKEKKFNDEMYEEENILSKYEELQNKYMKKSVKELEEECISTSSITETKFIVDELVWRDGGEDVSKYFKDNRVYIPDIPLQDKFLIFYSGEVSSIRQCRRGRNVELKCNEIAGEGNLRLLKYARENGASWSENTCSNAAIMGHLECLKYAHENGCEWDSSTCYSAASKGHLECLKYAHENGCSWDKNTCVLSAKYGYLECLKYAHENGCEWDEWICDCAARYGHLDCLKYAHENGCPWNEYTCSFAARNGHLDCLKYAHENGCEWDETTCNSAAISNRYECLKYAVDNKCPGYVVNNGFIDKTIKDLELLCISSDSIVENKYIIDELIWRDGENEASKYFKDNLVSIPNNIPLKKKFLIFYTGEVSSITQCRRKSLSGSVELKCSEIAGEGNLRLLKYAHENGFEWDIDTCLSAAEGGHLECLKYAHEHGFPWDRNTCSNAAIMGHLECLKYAHENGCEWNSSTCYSAASKGHLECLKYAHENGCPWDSDTCANSAENGHLECLKYAHDNGCEWDKWTCSYAAKNGHLECLKYAHENGCEWTINICVYAAANNKNECLKYAIDNGCPY